MVRAAFVAALVLLANVASATTMTKLDLAGLTQRAESVVAGHVTGSQSAWTSDHNAIYTDVTIVVERSLAGTFTPGQTVTVRSEGGSVDGVGMRVYGAAGFTKDEEVVVFLEQRAGHRYVVGMAQGKMLVTTDASGVKRLRRNLADVSFLPQNPASTAAGPSLQSISTLDELAAAVQRLRSKPAR